jgi:predicted nucleotidyltransferase
VLVFTIEQRDHVRERVLELGKSDPRVTAAAFVGSMAAGAEDERSDIDITFGITDGISPEAVLDDWTEVFRREFGALHHWDLRSGSSIYRVFLLPTGLEVDVSVTPQQDFGARGPSFRTLFGTARQLEPAPKPDAQHIIGLAWHHVLHARACIERAKPWQAEYWISAIRDYALTLACIRLGEEPSYARGTDRLSATVTDQFRKALVRSLDEPELRRALAVATACFISELDASDPALCAQLKPILQEYGAPQRL